MYRESLQNNRDRILLSKHLATIDRNVPIDFTVDAAKAAGPDVEALKQVYKELEFFSLIRELGPSEDAHTRDYRALESVEALETWIAAIPEGAPVAIADWPMRGASRSMSRPPVLPGEPLKDGRLRSTCCCRARRRDR